MTIGFVAYTATGKKDVLFFWNNADYIPRVGEFIKLESLGYHDTGNKSVMVQRILWQNKNEVEITVGL